MKLISLLLGATLFTLACSHDNGGGGVDPDINVKSIPDHIQLQTGDLPGVTDSDYATAKGFFKTSNAAQSLITQVLISSNESYDDQGVRESEYSRLTSDQQNAVSTLRANCQVVEDTQPSHATTLPFGVSIHTDCALANMKKEVNGTYSVVQADSSGYNGTVRVDVSGDLHALYKDQTIARAAGLTQEDIGFQASGLDEYQDGHERSYTRMKASGAVHFINGAFANSNIQVRAENLSIDGQAEVIIYMDVQVDGHSFHYAVHGTKGSQVIEFYIGNRALTSTEIDDLDGLDFLGQVI
jgi:hypothetical protein